MEVICIALMMGCVGRLIYEYKNGIIYCGGDKNFFIALGALLEITLGIVLISEILERL